MKDNIKYIILDFGKVIAAPTTGHWFITPKFLEVIDIDKIDINEFNEQIKVNDYILAKKILTVEEEYEMFNEFYNNILTGLNYPSLTSDMVNEIAHDFVYNSSKYTFYPNIEEELINLSSKYKLLMLTDNWPCVRRILKEKDLDKYFEKIYVSSELGYEKKDGIFFDFPINEYNINPGDALFIDDNESLLDIASTKNLDTRLMVRDTSKMVESNHLIVNDLDNIFKIKTL